MKRMLWIAAILFAACDDSIPGLCKVDSDCVATGPGAVCYSGVCAILADAGAGDAAVSAGDGGPPAGSADGGDAAVPEDAGAGDAALAGDGGPSADAGSDAGAQDAANVVTHTVTAVASAGGSISPASAAVADGATANLVVTANAGYLANVSGCGGSIYASVYTTGAITKDCTVTASFSSAATTLSLNPVAIKTFHFSWGSVATATGYVLLEDPDGASGYTQVARIDEGTSYDLVVPLPKRVNARYLLRACNAGGCADSATVAVSGNLVSAVGYVKASNTGASDKFGFSVALSSDGSTLAVGAPGEGSGATGIGGNQSDNSASESGAVYVFFRSGGNWAQQAYVKASNAEASDHFGRAVALSSDGNTLAVGAMDESSSATGVGGNQSDNSASGSGAVYVFIRSNGNWAQQAYVKASNAEAYDRFGYAVALSTDGNTLAVGADQETSSATGIGGNQSDNSMSESGAVYVFTRSNGAWAQQAYVKASNTGKSDNFGSAVALSSDGTTLAVGAYREASNATGIGGNQSDDSAFASGAVYVFRRNGGPWSQQAYVKGSNTKAGDRFGYAVALSSDGNTLAVGAMGEGSSATGINGSQSGSPAYSSGAVYIFTRSGAAWTQQAYAKASNTEAYDYFGSTVALSSDGNTLAVGATSESSCATGIGGNQADNSASGSGAVYVFTRSGANWNEPVYVKSSNAEAVDWFGSSVALSFDGNLLAVGATYESSGGTGVGGNQADNSASNSGAVYLY